MTSLLVQSLSGQGSNEIDEMFPLDDPSPPESTPPPLLLAEAVPTFRPPTSTPLSMWGSGYLTSTAATADFSATFPTLISKNLPEDVVEEE